MIEVFSTGTPVAAADVRAGDEIMVDDEVVLVLVAGPMMGLTQLLVEDYAGSVSTLLLSPDEPVCYAQRESLDNPATAMEIALALQDKGIDIL